MKWTIYELFFCTISHPNFEIKIQYKNLHSQKVQKISQKFTIVFQVHCKLTANYYYLHSFCRKNVVSNVKNDNRIELMEEIIAAKRRVLVVAHHVLQILESRSLEKQEQFRNYEHTSSSRFVAMEEKIDSWIDLNSIGLNYLFLRI